MWRNNSARAQIFVANNIAGGPTTLTATFVAPITTFGILYIHEYAGLDPTNPVDVASAASGTGNLLNSSSLTTTNSNDLLFGAGASDQSIAAPAPSFTTRSTGHDNLTADRTVTAAGTYAVTANHNGTAWVMQLVALRAATTSTSPTPTRTPIPMSTSTSTTAQTATPIPTSTSTSITAQTATPTRTSSPTPTAATPTPTPSPIVAKGPVAYPLKMSANHRYLVDQNNVPFLMVALAPGDGGQPDPGRC